MQFYVFRASVSRVVCHQVLALGFSHWITPSGMKVYLDSGLDMPDFSEREYNSLVPEWQPIPIQFLSIDSYLGGISWL